MGVDLVSGAGIDEMAGRDDNGAGRTTSAQGSERLKHFLISGMEKGGKGEGGGRANGRKGERALRRHQSDYQKHF